MLTSPNLTGICIWNGHGRLAFRWTWSISCSTNVLSTKDWDILARITLAMSHETSRLLVHLLTICAIVKDRASLICNLIWPLKGLNMENLGQVISISNSKGCPQKKRSLKNLGRPVSSGPCSDLPCRPGRVFMVRQGQGAELTGRSRFLREPFLGTPFRIRYTYYMA